MRRLTVQKFIERAKQIHGEFYDYSEVDYKNANTKVIILCPTHGSFTCTPWHHMDGVGCGDCWREKNDKHADQQLTQDEFLRRVIHLPLDFSKSIYAGRRKKVLVSCPVHGEFMKSTASLLKGHGCKRCAADAYNKNRGITTAEFVKRAIKIHGNKYDYSKVKFNKLTDDIFILCDIHNGFYQQANSHLHGNGCIKCRESRGEKKIRVFLESKGINFESQKKFDFALMKRLPFDFYIPKHNLVIEYDGDHHFKEVTFYHRTLEEVQFVDRVKNNFCELKGIKLLRINYEQFDDIETILDHQL